ncbi:uncharacterized protein [Cicer arietinum]|uniref:uncharacterized protein isoform X3 n=1 Tax=Cicer arietinum TaxID=3827 RepID=UPI003CC6C53B
MAWSSSGRITDTSTQERQQQKSCVDQEIQSDPAPIAVSTSQITEDDKHQSVIPEISEETVSNVDCHSDGYDAQLLMMSKINLQN